MGNYSISSYYQGGIIYLATNMLSFFFLPAFALAAPAAEPLYSLGVGVAHTHVQPITSCQTVAETALQESCHVEHSEVCHTEYDTVVETNHVSECSDVVTQECTQTSTSVFPTTSVRSPGWNLHQPPPGQEGSRRQCRGRRAHRALRLRRLLSRCRHCCCCYTCCRCRHPSCCRGLPCS